MGPKFYVMWFDDTERKRLQREADPRKFLYRHEDLCEQIIAHWNDELASGSYGTVIKLDENYVAKLFKDIEAADNTALECLASVMASEVQGSGLVSSYALGWIGPTMFIVMERAKCTIHDLVVSYRSRRAKRKSGEEEDDEAKEQREVELRLDLIEGVLYAVTQMHACVGAHLDIKSTNFLARYGANGGVLIQLCDFSLARLRSVDDGTVGPISRRMRYFRYTCTEPYAPPEAVIRRQIRAEVNPLAIDCFSVGLLILELMFMVQPRHSLPRLETLLQYGAALRFSLDEFMLEKKYEEEFGARPVTRAPVGKDGLGPSSKDKATSIHLDPSTKVGFFEPMKTCRDDGSQTNAYADAVKYLFEETAGLTETPFALNFLDKTTFFDRGSSSFADKVCARMLQNGTLDAILRKLMKPCPEHRGSVRDAFEALSAARGTRSIAVRERLSVYEFPASIVERETKDEEEVLVEERWTPNFLMYDFFLRRCTSSALDFKAASTPELGERVEDEIAIAEMIFVGSHRESSGVNCYFRLAKYLCYGWKNLLRHGSVPPRLQKLRCKPRFESTFFFGKLEDVDVG